MTKTLQTSAIESVQQSIQNIISLVKDLSEKEIRWNPSAEEWSIMQIITHVAEAIPYWVREIQQIIEHPDQTWGRGLTDETRLKMVSEENVNSLQVSDVLDQLASIPLDVEETLQALSSEDLEIIAPSRNPRFDGKPVEFIVNHLIVEHVEKHYHQIQRNLSKFNQ
ncbi:DinB family protein [Metabacillus litoralis]|uniref:DinB family protein n=1 Tax=Metabacillus litoralis TaxID=152268 RepID=UPI001BA09AEF|nr:DinB family protein [Metabacillus litoralis]MCM3160619.1 DinB family protein [Metabacillus litoralis]UHA60005.1 DinB family protein [Metabacillus litoralis]